MTLGQRVRLSGRKTVFSEDVAAGQKSMHVPERLATYRTSSVPQLQDNFKLH